MTIFLESKYKGTPSALYASNLKSMKFNPFAIRVSALVYGERVSFNDLISTGRPSISG
jgi:hypothetical protein